MNYLTWNKLKELVEAELKSHNLEDIEIWSIDLWQPADGKINITIGQNDYDINDELEDKLTLRVRDI